MTRGALVTLEGGEGAGKSTVLTAVRACIEAHGIGLHVTREPGGTRLGEALRQILLDPAQGGMCAESELLLMFASRAQLVREQVLPALERGEWVLSDRFTDASYAYQGGGRGQPTARIAELERWAACALQPDLTLLLDLSVEQGLQRARQRAEADRIEAEHADFFEGVRASYRARAGANPGRFRIIDAGRGIDDVRAEAVAAVEDYIATRKARA